MTDKAFVVHGHWRQVKLADGRHKVVWIAAHVKKAEAPHAE